MTGPDDASSPPPLPAPARIPELDVLRGFAILGILLLNIRDFSMAEGAYFFPASYDHFSTWSDKAVWVVGEIFWSHKFYSLLALLLGAGIVLMAGSAEQAGARPAVRHYRRMAGLAGLGLCHAYLIWHGDILLHYALCGMIAYPLRKAAAGALFGLGMFLIAADLGYDFMDALPADSYYFHADDNPGWVDQELDVYRGPWHEQMAWRMERAWRYQSGSYRYMAETIGLMLMGMAMIKSGWPAAWRVRPRLFLLAIPCCLFGWLTSAAAIGWWAWEGFEYGGKSAMMSCAMALGGVVTMFGYLASIQIWLRGGRFRFISTILAAVGRTALSNYLAQSLIATFIFHGQGLALVGTLGRAEQLLAVVAIWSIQITLTLIWLERFSQGPAEWLLRRLSGRKNGRLLLKPPA